MRLVMLDLSSEIAYHGVMKNVHAVSLGRSGGLKGGPARAAALSTERRREMLKVLPLDRVIASKKEANRPKDRAYLPTLRAALASLRNKDLI